MMTKFFVLDILIIKVNGEDVFVKETTKQFLLFVHNDLSRDITISMLYLHHFYELILKFPLHIFVVSIVLATRLLRWKENVYSNPFTFGLKALEIG